MLRRRAFGFGQSVHMTDRAIEQGLDGRRKIAGESGRHGVVQAIREPFSVKVLRAGRKKADWFYVGFWTPCSSDSACARAEGR